MCKRLNKNEMHKTFWDLEIQIDHLISSGWQKKKNSHLQNFAVHADHRVKMKASKKIFLKILRPCWRAKRIVEH